MDDDLRAKLNRRSKVMFWASLTTLTIVVLSQTWLLWSVTCG